MKQKIIISVVFVALLLLALAFVAEASGVTNFTSITLSEDLIVGGDAEFDGTMAMDGGFSVDSPAFVVADTTGALTTTGAIAANGGLSVDTPAFTVANATGNVATTGTLQVTGISTLTGAVAANGGFAVDTPAFVVADTTGALTTTGAAALNGGFSVDTPAFVVADTTGALTTTGAIAANGGISVDTPAFTVADTTGNIGTTGTLDVTGISTLTGAVAANGGFSVDSPAFVIADTTGALTTTGAIAADGGISVDTTAFTVANTTGNVATTGTLDVTGVSTLTGAVTTAADLTVSPEATGGNAGARNEISGLFRLGIQPTVSVWSNGTTETVAWIDDTPTGEWAEVDAATNLVVTADPTYYKDGTTSILMAFTDVVDNDGIDGDAPAQDDWSAVDSFGFWIYSDIPITSGDFDLTVDDSDGTDQVYVIPAVAADIWTWVEIDISGCDGNCDTVDGVFFLATAQGDTNLGGAAVNIYIDAAYKWDIGDEEALGADILNDGVLAVLALVDANTGVHNQVLLVEYTDYFVNYEAGVDFLVAISDQGANSATMYFAY